MKGLRLLIVDDEKPAIKKIRSFLKEESRVDFIIEAENGFEASQKIMGQRPDLVFLDIQMPGMNGFEVIEAVGIENMPPVIFVTAYDRYAIEAFDVQAVDYLLKPFDQERFEKSFKRALERIQSRDENVAIYKRLIDEIRKEKKYLQRIMVNESSRYFFVKTSDILYFSAEEKYVRIHTMKESYLIRETMGHLEERLDPSKFSRIHRSSIVNIDCIKEVQPWSHGDYVVVLKNGLELNASRRYRNRLFGRM